MKEKLIADPLDLPNSDQVISIISDGTTVAEVTPSGELKTSDATAQASLANIETALTVGPLPSVQIGTDDGTLTGTQYVFVNNEKQQILSAHDRSEAYTWLNFGTKNERISRVDYTSATFPGVTVRQDFSYTLSGTQYRLDTIIWSIV